MKISLVFLVLLAESFFSFSSVFVAKVAGGGASASGTGDGTIAEGTAAATATTSEVVRSQTSNSDAPDNSPAHANHEIDGYLSTCLSMSDQEEVAVCRFAAENLQSDQVKQFANEMIEDLTLAKTKWFPFAPVDSSPQHRQTKNGANQVLSDVAKYTIVPGQPNIDRNTQPPTGELNLEAGTDETLLLQIECKARQEYLELTKKELQKQGVKGFDQAFLSQQLISQSRKLAQLNAFELYASPELRSIIRQQCDATKQKLDQLRELKQLSLAKRG